MPVVPGRVQKDHKDRGVRAVVGVNDRPNPRVVPFHGGSVSMMQRPARMEPITGFADFTGSSYSLRHDSP
jgi:hypothetical protein